ncbi:DUF6059 family protein [Streptacidiphilus rugosus]|uniref:DUF6059 family protein n=1 Tax=Streptacidiphilus rugosus TaxID=405783 RepID=UPI000565AFA7|nr:DUF6059 family protein [Streptacidiphilus rugosus]
MTSPRTARDRRPPRLPFRLRWWLRLLGREVYRGLVQSGCFFGLVTPEYAAALVADLDDRPAPGHPERLVRGTPPSAQEAALWRQLDQHQEEPTSGGVGARRA